MKKAVLCVIPEILLMNSAPRILFTVENKRIPGPLLMTALKIKF